MSRVRGTVDPDFAPVAEALRAVVHGWHDRRDRRGFAAGGAAVAVYLRGELVVDAWTGVRNLAGDPWERDTVAMSFSTTKGVVSTVLHRLVDRGLVDYDAPVARYWPEFAQAGKEGVTVRHLLTHSAGMHGVRALVVEPDDIFDWDLMTSRLAAAAPAWEVGSRPGYQALTYGWLVGEVIRRAGGYASVSEAVQREIAEPIGADGMFVGVPPGDRHRLATLIGQPPEETPTGRVLDRLRGRSFLEPFVEAFDAPGFGTLMLTDAVHDGEIPSANGAFTARSLARMYSGLVSPEAFPGPPLVSAPTLARATEVQTTARDGVVGVSLQWRLGYHLAATNRGVLPRGFGHFGYGGSGGWGDPTSGLALGFVVNRVAGTPFADGRFLRIGSAAARCARRRERLVAGTGGAR
jgi:CubicO group peptidase (beta-lactamase class C family)